MNIEIKNEIIVAAKKYSELHKLSQNQLAKNAGINSGYLSAMMRNQYTTKVNNENVPISDKWFSKLAEYVGYALKKTYWRNVATRQFMEGIHALEVAKSVNKATMIIGSTGIGKSNIIELFVKKHPKHTYVITVSSLYKLNDVINELADKIGVDFNNGQRNTTKDKVDMIIEKLININQSTNDVPLLIIDEGENTKMPLLNMLKALYDKIIPYASIAIIGTEQLLHKLHKLRKNSMDAVPQFARRFKAGTVTLSQLDKSKDFAEFFRIHKIDNALAALLTKLCDNYGELHDYLEPALKYADKKGGPLTEKLFRLMYNLPNY